MCYVNRAKTSNMSVYWDDVYWSMTAALHATKLVVKTPGDVIIRQEICLSENVIRIIYIILYLMYSITTYYIRNCCIKSSLSDEVLT